MPHKASQSPLADRLASLGITPAELAAIVKRPPDLVQVWIDAGPDLESVVLLRFLDDDADAMRRVDQLRRKHTRSLRGESAEHAGVDDVPYGSADAGKATGGVPQ